MATLLFTVMGLGLYLLVRGVVHVTTGAVTSPAALRPYAAAASFLANYFWLASICFGSSARSGSACTRK